MKRFLFIPLAAVVAIVIAYFVFSGRVKMVGHIETIGVVEATEVEISSKVSGRLDWLCCEEGAGVKNGDILVRLDSKEARARLDEAVAFLKSKEAALKEAETFVEGVRAEEMARQFGVKEAEAEIERLKTLLEDAKKDFDRTSSLYKEGVVAERDFDSAMTRYDSLRAELLSTEAKKSSSESLALSARARVKAAEAELLSSKARLDEAFARVNLFRAGLEDTAIPSPMDGTIVYKAFEAGETVPAGVAIYTVHDAVNIWARVDIEETAIGNITPGGRAVVTTRALPGKEFEGEVIEIGSVGEFATQRDVTRGRPDVKTFRVKVAIKGHGGLLKAGMTVSVRFF